MKKNIIKSTLLMGMFLIIMFLLQGKAQAASISISPSKTSASPGEKVTITVSSDCTGRINVSAAGGTLSASSVWVEGNSQSVTLTVGNSGTATVTAQPVTLSSSTGQDVAVGAKSCSVKVATSSSSGGSSSSSNNSNSGSTNNQQPQQKSNNAKLANLGIKPNDFSGFSPNKTSYSVTVPNSVSSVSVYANKGQSGQTISGTGTINLQEGVNQANVTVTAEDGKTKTTYTISITRQAGSEDEKDKEEEENTTDTNTVEEDEVENGEEKEITVGLDNLTISDVTLSPTFEKDIYEYTAKLIGDKTELDINAVAIDEGQKIEIIGNEDLEEGENTITIMVSSEDGEETATYQIIVNKSLVDEEAIAREKEEEQKKKNQQRMIIIGALVGGIVIVGSILLVRFIRYRKNMAEDYSDMDYQENDENIQEFEEHDENEENIYNFEEKEDDDIKDVDDFEKKPKKRKGKGKRFKD